MQRHQPAQRADEDQLTQAIAECQAHQLRYRQAILFLG
jgi:hypothetical protein